MLPGFQNENLLSFYSKTLPNKFDHMLDFASGIFDKGDSEMHPMNGLDSSSYKNKCHDDGLLSSLKEENIRAMETDYNEIIDPVSVRLAKEKTKAAASLVVPEKSSSFSIHPNRLCSDVCKYCFGKFGSLGQIKNPERQKKLLLHEPNLKLDTCLCNACYRFVNRKANKPPQKHSKSNTRQSMSSSSSKRSNYDVGFHDITDLLKPLKDDGDKNSASRIQVKFGNLNIGKLSNLNIGQNSSIHQSEPKHDKSDDKDVPLIADFCFKTPTDGQKNWNKCVSTILFDKETKRLWQDLQKPYGNQSSFIRHLILLERYWRSGALDLARNADAGAVKYINSVKNRIQSFETSSSPSLSPSPAPPSVVVTKPPPIPTLQPASTSSVETTGPSSVHYVQSGSSKTSPVDSAVRHTPAPPPLLKIDQTNGIPFNPVQRIE